MGTAPESPARHRRRPFRRFLHVMLDVRQRWWLALWFWLPVGGVVVVATLSRQSDFGNSSATYVDTVWLVSEGGGYRVAEYRDRPPVPLWFVHCRLEYATAPTQYRARISYTFGKTSQPPLPNDDAALHALIAKALAGNIDSGQFEVTDDRAAKWVFDTWKDLAGEGGGSRTGLAAPNTLAAYYGLSLIRWLAIAGIALSLLHWLLSGMQVGAYKRMLRRHEAGHCPHCNYDIAAHPDAVCPECGCDHRARRREAIDALRRAKQWPLKGAPPSDA